MNNTQQPSKKNKPLAALSLDVDNKWSYMKIRGLQGWKTFPSYLDICIPQVLDILDSLDLKITFFIVGQDAAIDRNADSLKLITERGHEVGNHSFYHETWLHLYSKEQLKKEILDAENQIIRVTGQKPYGFRGPGFSWTINLLEVLHECNYIYDASSLPTYIGPLARAYYFFSSNSDDKVKLTDEEKSKRNGLFGSFKDGLRPVKPYSIRLPSGVEFLEIPVTTTPVIKTPFHLTYLMYLSQFSPLLMKCYLNLAITMCRVTNTCPSFLLHPLDFLSADQVPELAFFPGMDVPYNRKKELLYTVINKLSKHFELVNMSVYAQSILN